MRELVMKKSFMIRRGLDTILHAIWPNGWVPLYNSIHFSRMGFRDCIANRAWQDKVHKLYKSDYFSSSLVVNKFTFLYVYFQMIRRSVWCFGIAAFLSILLMSMNPIDTIVKIN